jgi:hypothetical protein
MYQHVYYIWVSNDDKNTGEDKVWETLGAYSRQEDAESHKLSLLLSKEYKEVVIVPGPMRVIQDYAT